LDIGYREGPLAYRADLPLLTQPRGAKLKAQGLEATEIAKALNAGAGVGGGPLSGNGSDVMASQPAAPKATS
jgi:hypothetical protein